MKDLLFMLCLPVLALASFISRMILKLLDVFKIKD